MSSHLKKRKGKSKRVSRERNNKNTILRTLCLPLSLPSLAIPGPRAQHSSPSYQFVALSDLVSSKPEHHVLYCTPTDDWFVSR